MGQLDHAENQPQIAYLIKCFPRVSETFILHEVLELERQGVHLHIYSLLAPPAAAMQAQAVCRVAAPVTYLPRSFPRGWLRLMGSMARCLRRRPRTLGRIALGAVVETPRLATVRHIALAVFLAEQMQRDEVTTLHAHFANTPATVARMVHSLTGMPYSFTAHAKDIYTTPPHTLRRNMAAATHVITCSEYNAHFLRVLAGTESSVRVTCIYHGMAARSCTAPGRGPTPAATVPLILTVARLVEKKGLADLLRACCLLQAHGRPFTCRIVGEGPLRPLLERQIRALGLSARVQLWGAVSHEDVLAMYAEAMVAALPSVISANGDRDGIPNALVEALFLGVPAVATPISGIPELIEDGVTGLLVPPRDSAALADALARLLDDASLRQRLAGAGYRTVQARFDLTRNVACLRLMLLAHLARDSSQPAARPEALRRPTGRSRTEVLA